MTEPDTDRRVQSLIVGLALGLFFAAVMIKGDDEQRCSACGRR